jgi:hypothetical protein
MSQQENIRAKFGEYGGRDAIQKKLSLQNVFVTFAICDLTLPCQHACMHA